MSRYRFSLGDLEAKAIVARPIDPEFSTFGSEGIVKSQRCLEAAHLEVGHAICERLECLIEAVELADRKAEGRHRMGYAAARCTQP